MKGLLISIFLSILLLVQTEVLARLFVLLYRNIRDKKKLKTFMSIVYLMISIAISFYISTQYLSIGQIHGTYLYVVFPIIAVFYLIHLIIIIRTDRKSEQLRIKVFQLNDEIKSTQKEIKELKKRLKSINLGYKNNEVCKWIMCTI